MKKVYRFVSIAFGVVEGEKEVAMAFFVADDFDEDYVMYKRFSEAEVDAALKSIDMNGVFAFEADGVSYESIASEAGNDAKVFQAAYVMLGEIKE